jgi:hypothetical protein
MSNEGCPPVTHPPVRPASLFLFHLEAHLEPTLEVDELVNVEKDLVGGVFRDELSFDDRFGVCLRFEASTDEREGQERERSGMISSSLDTRFYKDRMRV